MSTRGEKCLAIRAHQQIGICCETLCEKDVVIEYIEELETKLVEAQEQIEKLERANKLYEKLHNKLMHNAPEKSGQFFICGGIGAQDDFGVPDRILICPQYGLDGFYVFKKESDYAAPEW
jgi:hypothetical protein